MQIEHKTINPLRDRLDEEIGVARDQALRRREPIEPTDEERKNGWTTETLTEYLAERQAAQELQVDVNSLSRRSARRPDEQNHRYRPHRWRR